jgi:hypothetical protein
MINYTKVRTIAPWIYFPKGEQKYVCLGCELTFSKSFYAKNHFPKCNKEHLQACKDLIQELPFGNENAQSSEVSEAPKAPETPQNEIVVLAYQKIIRTLRCDLMDATHWMWWFNKLNEDSSLNERITAYEDKMPGDWNPESEDDYYEDLDENCLFKKDLEVIGLTGKQIIEAATKRYPLAPPR